MKHEIHGNTGEQVSPKARSSVPHTFTIDGLTGYTEAAKDVSGELVYMTVSLPEEAALARPPINIAVAAANLMLAKGVPIEEIAEAFIDGELIWPYGKTDDPYIKTVVSPVDYVFRWLGHMFAPAGFLDRHPPKPVPQ